MFEALRSTPEVGVAIWWRDWADPTISAITDPEGCLRLCGGESHRLPPPLAMDALPDALVTAIERQM